MNKILIPILLSSGIITTIAHAEIGFGVGLTYTLGKHENTGLAIGPKIFTNNKEKKVVASAGIDYLIKSSSFRPNIGISYLFKENLYTDLNIGYNLSAGKKDFGISIGYTKTDTNKCDCEIQSSINTPDPNLPKPNTPDPNLPDESPGLPDTDIKIPLDTGGNYWYSIGNPIVLIK